MNSVISTIEHSSSLFENKWKLKNFDERNALAISQKFDLTSLIGKLLSIRNIKEEDIDFYLNPNINNHIPDPNQIKDMDIAIKRVAEAILKNETPKVSKKSILSSSHPDAQNKISNLLE